MKRINVNVLLAWLIGFGITAIVLIGCASPAMPELTLSPSLLPQIATPVRQAIVPRPAQPVPPQNPLPDLPLKLGAAWVYSNVVYSGSNPQDIVTSTYIYTDVVINTRSVPPYFAAELSRTVSLIDGKPLDNSLVAETWWYIISGTQIYKQPSNELDFAKTSTSWLEYVFPLSQNRWYPDSEIRQNASLDDMVSGIRYTFPESEVTVPAGLFKDCYMIDTAYLNGPTLSWFCSDAGVVAEKFDHSGTPFGYHAVLMNYSIPPAP